MECLLRAAAFGAGYWTGSGLRLRIALTCGWPSRKPVSKQLPFLQGASQWPGCHDTPHCLGCKEPPHGRTAVYTPRGHARRPPHRRTTSGWPSCRRGWRSGTSRCGGWVTGCARTSGSPMLAPCTSPCPTFSWVGAAALGALDCSRVCFKAGRQQRTSRFRMPSSRSHYAAQHPARWALLCCSAAWLERLADRSPTACSPACSAVRHSTVR